MFPEYKKILDGYDIGYSFLSDRLEYINNIRYHRVYMKPSSENKSTFSVFASLLPSRMSSMNYLKGGDYDQKCCLTGLILENFELNSTMSVRVRGKDCVTSYSYSVKFSELDNF